MKENLSNTLISYGVIILLAVYTVDSLARISHDGVRVKGEQAQINENRDELEHSAPWRSNSLGKLRSDRGEMTL